MTDDMLQQPTPLQRIAAMLTVCDHDLDLNVDDPGRDIWNVEFTCGFWRVVTINRVEPARRRLWTVRFLPQDKVIIEGVFHECVKDYQLNARPVTDAVYLWRGNEKARPGVEIARKAARDAFTT